MSSLRAVLALGACLALGIGGGCGKRTEAPPVIGVVFPATGEKAGIGALVKEGFDLAQEELREGATRGGRQIEIRYADTEGVPSVARTAFGTVVGRYGAVAVVG